MQPSTEQTTVVDAPQQQQQQQPVSPNKPARHAHNPYAPSPRSSGSNNQQAAARTVVSPEGAFHQPVPRSSQPAAQIIEPSAQNMTTTTATTASTFSHHQQQQQQAAHYGPSHNGGGGSGHYHYGRGGMRGGAPRGGGGDHHHHHHHQQHYNDNASGTTAGITMQGDPASYQEVYSATQDTLYILPRTDIIALPSTLPTSASTDDVTGLPLPTGSKIQLCPHFDAKEPETSCPNGARCRYVHAKTDNALVHEIHVNYAWPSLDDCHSERFSGGQLLQVAPPNNGVSLDEIPAHMVLKTRALQSNRRVISHCAHYYFNRACNRGPNCMFIHAVSITPKDSEEQPAAAASTDKMPVPPQYTRLWGRTQQRRTGTSAVAAGASYATPTPNGGTPVNEYHNHYRGGSNSSNNNMRRNESSSSLNFDSPLGSPQQQHAGGGFSMYNSHNNSGYETPLRGTPVNMQEQVRRNSNGYSTPTAVNSSNNVVQQISPSGASTASGAPSTAAGAPVAAPFGSFNSQHSSLVSTPMKRGNSSSVQTSPDSSMADVNDQYYMQQQQYSWNNYQQQQQMMMMNGMMATQQSSTRRQQQQQHNRYGPRGRRMNNPYSITNTVQYLAPLAAPAS